MAQLAIKRRQRDRALARGGRYVRLSGDGGDLAVIEVNSNPMIATLEDNGRWDLIDRNLARELRRGAANEHLARPVSEVWRGPGA